MIKLVLTLENLEDRLEISMRHVPIYMRVITVVITVVLSGTLHNHVLLMIHAETLDGAMER
jgi:hypothetical protein